MARESRETDQSIDHIERFTAGICPLPFIKLELIPKAAYHRNQNELKFYNEYFSNLVAKWVNDLSLLYADGLKIGSRFGLKALDSLHIAAALIASCDEFITSEKPTSPLNRVISIVVLTIY